MKMLDRISARQIWRLLIVVAICWGCWLRFYKLDAKVYWEDEVFTSLRLSGYSHQELVEQTFHGDIVYPADLLQFQIAHEDKSIGDVIHGLTEDTHPPAYFVLLRLWSNWFGYSTTSVRALSATVSLLLLPSVFGIAWLLFERSPQRQAIAELATALVAVSPYQISLANEARMYSLLPVATTLAGLCLLWAIRRQRQGLNRGDRLGKPLSKRAYRHAWGWYGLLSASSLYVHWLAVPILVGYGFYVWLQQQAVRSLHWSLHWARAQKRYLLMSAFTVGAILPWVAFMGRGLSNVYYQTKWTGEAVTFWGAEESLGQLWLQHGLMLFFNGDILAQLPILKWMGGGLAIAFVGWALIYLVRHTALPVWSFLLISSGIIYAPLAVSDIFLGGRRSGIFRYFSPSIGAIEITVAFALVSLGGVAFYKTHSDKTHSDKTQSGQRRSDKASDNENKGGLRMAARSAIAFLLISGALSQTVAKVTYSVDQQPLGDVASVVNSTPNAILVSDAPRPSLLLPLAHLLKDETPLMLTVRPNLPTLREVRDRPVFLYLTSEAFQTSLEAQGNYLRPVADVDNLFSVEPAQIAAIEPAQSDSTKPGP